MIWLVVFFFPNENPILFECFVFHWVFYGWKMCRISGSFNSFKPIQNCFASVFCVSFFVSNVSIAVCTQIMYALRILKSQTSLEIYTFSALSWYRSVDKKFRFRWLLMLLQRILNKLRVLVWRHIILCFISPSSSKSFFFGFCFPSLALNSSILFYMRLTFWFEYDLPPMLANEAEFPFCSSNNFGVFENGFKREDTSNRVKLYTRHIFLNITNSSASVQRQWVVIVFQSKICLI